jgi:hypothetical protein
MDEGEDERTPADTRVATRRWAAVLVAVAVSVAAAVAALQPGDGERSAPGTAAPPSTSGPTRVIRQVSFSEDRSDMPFCWITITITDGRPHNVTVRWGSRQKEIWQQDPGPLVYSFAKRPPSSVPLVVEADDGVEVTFAEGAQPPEGSSDEGNNGWSLVPGS